MLFFRMDVAFSASVVWSLFAIAIRQTDETVMTGAYVMAGILSLFALVVFGWRMKNLYKWMNSQRWEPRGVRKF